MQSPPCPGIFWKKCHVASISTPSFDGICFSNQAKEARRFGLIKVQCGTEGKLRTQITTKTWNPTTQRYLRTRGRRFFNIWRVFIYMEWHGAMGVCLISIFFVLGGEGLKATACMATNTFWDLFARRVASKTMVAVSRSNDQLSIHKFTIEKKTWRLPEP